jgi:hypothetical protein
MPSDTALSTSVEALLARHRSQVLAELQRRRRRALSDNPQGSAIVDEALGRALLIGVHVQCELDRRSPRELEAGPDAWDEWMRARDETPESLDWPRELADTAPEELERAAKALRSAGAELDLHSREIRDLCDAGKECAEAGAALARCVLRPRRSDPEPPAAELSPHGPLEIDGTVRVALAANQPECELIQGLLKTAGIPSAWRRTGGDLPYLLAAGYREIYVPAAAAGAAQTILATTGTVPHSHAGEPHTHRVGLERRGVRVIGKATATLMLLGVLTASISLFLSDDTAVAVAALLGLIGLIAAIVAWSEHNSVR